MQLGSHRWQKIIIEGALGFDIRIDQDQAGLFATHARELFFWNKKINLTAIKDPREIAIKHFIDSVIAAKFLPSSGNLIDIGSGGGFPAIPLKIINPGIDMVLIDKVRKKVSFIKHIIRTLKLNKIEAMHIKAEDMARSGEFSGFFHVAICRALTGIEDFFEIARPFVRPGGKLIAMKGKISHNDRKGMENIKNQGIVLRADKYLLPFVNAKRSIIEIEV